MRRISKNRGKAASLAAGAAMSSLYKGQSFRDEKMLGLGSGHAVLSDSWKEEEEEARMTPGFASEGMPFTEVVTHKEEVICGNTMYLGEVSPYLCTKYVTQTLYEVR